MPESPKTPEPSYSDLIDRVCDQFETLLHQGARPRIEEYLPLVPNAARDRLLRELVSLEIDILHSPGDTLPFARYYQRFPTAAAVLDALRAEWDRQHEDPAGFDVASSPKPMDETAAFAGASQRFRHFELKSVIGKGGFGVVWHAWDLKLQRDVAIKFPRAERLAEIDKSLFLREARAAARLDHRHIVGVYEISDDEQQTYIVSELVDGQNLKEFLRAASFNPREAALLVAKLASAVHHAHTQGIIHRDVKPANVLIDRQQEPHITDFGLAKREASDESISVDGHLLGTPTYMAPEQASGDHRAIDARTDIYALGVMLYELLTGGPPFRGEQRQLLQQIRETPPAPPRKIKPDIPKDLEAICLKCLEKDRSKRYATAQALADDLHFYLNGETLRGIPAPLHNRAWKWYRRNRRQVLIAAGVSLVAAISAGLFAWNAAPKGPMAESRTVLFETEPEGCEITVVKIDPATGEPDSTQIQHAPKGTLTPLTMKLAPGDYLVVAVLDNLRFHEVQRHVPSSKDATPMGYGYQFWKVLDSGVIQVSAITIPRPDISVGMGFVEGIERLIAPSADRNKETETWCIPPFYIDLQEASPAALILPTDSEDSIRFFGDGPFAVVNFHRAIGRAEHFGKRLPSAAELYYLSTKICPAPEPAGEAAPAETPDAPCRLADQHQSQILELHSGAWEWTTTLPGGPLTGVAAGVHVPGQGPMRVAGGGALLDAVVTRTGFKMQPEVGRSSQTGVRFVRSAKPRRAAKDFVAPSNSADAPIPAAQQ